MNVNHGVGQVTAVWMKGYSGAAVETLDSNDNALADPDDNESGFQAALGAASTRTVFKVKVTSQDTTATKTYVIT